MKYKDHFVKIPENRIVEYADDILLLDFESAKNYKLFLKINYGKIKGINLIPEFKESFELGKSYEAYNMGIMGIKKILFRTDLNEGEVKYIIQIYQKYTSVIFSEINKTIEPNFSFVYLLRKNIFCFIPLTSFHNELISLFNEQFKKDWRILMLSGNNPVYFLFNKEFQKVVKVCGGFHDYLMHDAKKYPDYPLDGAYPELKKNNKKIQKIYKNYDVNIHLTFNSYFDRLNRLNAALDKDLGVAIKKTTLDPDDYLDIPVLVLPFAIYISFDAYKEVIPIYILPNGETTLVIFLLPNKKSYMSDYFEHFESIYHVLRMLFKIL